MKRKNKKAATPFTILLLVVMALVLAGVALFSFSKFKADNEKFLYQSFEDIYAKEAEINFYLSQGGDLKDIVKLADDVKVEIEGEEVILKKMYKDKKGRVMDIAYKFKPKLE